MKFRKIMKSRKWSAIIKICLVISCMICFFPVPTQAISAKNKKAHAAFEKQLKKEKKRYCYRSDPYIEYAYCDLDKDKVDEMIVTTTVMAPYELIFRYNNGKVEKVASADQGQFNTYYKKNKVLCSGYAHMGVCYDMYYKWDKSEYKLVAYKRIEGVGTNDIHISYNVKKKNVSKKTYNNYIKKLKKGDKGRKFSNIKRKKY